MRLTFRFFPYRCPRGHRFEALVELSQAREKQPCQEKGCRKQAIPEHYYQTREAIKPTTIYEKVVDGKLDVQFPGSSKDAGTAMLESRGYQRRELIEKGDIKRFEKEQSLRIQREAESKWSADRERFSQAQSVAFQEMRDTYPFMDDTHRELSEYVMQRIVNEGMGETPYSKSYDPQFRIAGRSE